MPAAGLGRRFGSGENKIWALLGRKTIIERTLESFNSHFAIDSIVIAASPDEIDRVRSVGTKYQKVVSVVAGGETRNDSVRRGMMALPTDTEIVLVHDAARPLISALLIDRIISATIEHGAAVPGTPLSDTVKRVDSFGLIRATVSRNALLDGELLAGLTAVQTPQGARIELLRDAYKALDLTGAEATDEASMIEAMGGTVAVTYGDATNIKITRSEDVAIAERLLGYGEIRTGMGYDVHTFASPEAGRALWLGGVEIPHDRGLEGHSDADVVLHAVCDALLGAASLGDIGILFPNTDSKYKDVSSLTLLSVVRERLASACWIVVNVDATVLAEAPKLMPYRDAMLSAIASELGVEAERVSIKATTSEGMGFVGRREGIACWAVATLRR
jgi:2-C-methyl-D-erythritol 4-phosphate cytidylyltransferase/2-C-methyl-D-erythritol 2,4-cyclodiphosphate synthase